MPDHATSADPAVQAQLDRLWALGPGADTLGLDRITRLLARLDDPHLRLPPVFHVAGTNGKGSTCAFLRAALEASGHQVHVYTSPHLVRFNERIRLAGTLIDDAVLAPLLEEVLDAGGDIGASFFEVTTAAAFLAFARTPADACVIEVGLGGRLDATNVIPAPLVCGIAALGIDHQSFLGDTLEAIAAEKAGIAKPGVPLVTLGYADGIAKVIARTANAAGAMLQPAGTTWHVAVKEQALVLEDRRGHCLLPRPALLGEHQYDNIGLAAEMLRCQDVLDVPDHAIARAATEARWPARLQRLGHGPLTALLPETTSIWLDGGHNASAGNAIARALPQIADAAPIHVVLGMLANKDVAGFLAPMAERIASLVAVPTPGHAHHDPASLAAMARALGIPRTATAGDVPEALSILAHEAPKTTLVAGSLYLAGLVLAANHEPPN